ncbi:MAG TPA: HAD-IC family P-type ATPase [Candidatus Paceibacterota bacterium]|nr:HAD-IC family P-type ATPase [Candidatus Paceibacterota bacterium]
MLKEVDKIDNEKKWHSLKVEEVVRIFDTDTNKGLSEKEAKERLKKFGTNRLPEEKSFSHLKILLDQFTSPLIFILVIAGIICLVINETTDAIVIFSAVILNVIVGFFQENKASQILMSLKKVVKHEAEVLRDGHLKVIDSTLIVPGDIVILNAGNKVPADGLIIETYELTTNEAALTGEWMPTHKTLGRLPQATPLADRDNMVYMGTVVENGKGKFIATETGVNTEIGKIATMVQETKEEKSPYQKKLANFSKIVGIIILFICIGIFVEGMLSGGNFIEMFTISIAVAVASIPEGLPVAMTVVLAVGMQRILKKGGLVKKLASAETLGSTSVIATDKTATLTEGKMVVREIISKISNNNSEENNKNFILKAATLASEAFIENPEEIKENWIVRGRPTDKALLEAGIKAGINKQDFEKYKLLELPFNSERKFNGVIYNENEQSILYICGAPEKILHICNLNNEERKQLEEKLEELTKNGLRVVATAYKTLKNIDVNKINIEYELKDLNFMGFISLEDPIRKEVKEAMKLCRQAGVNPIIVTGDHKLTAKAVAKELGFEIKEKNILEGKDLDKISDIEFEKILDNIKIYARVEPRHKMRIVAAWQKRGEVIAMIGDGINDAPALKKADIGVAVGSGTEVAKEAADLILLNDSFSIIITAIEEGRGLLDNIRKVITYLMSDSFTEVILIGVSIFAGVPLPITAVQILYINLIEDGLPNMALAFEPKENDLMQQKPQKLNVPLLNKEMKSIIFIIGLITDLILLSVFFLLLRQNYELDYLRTMIFAMLAIDSISYVFYCKSLRKNIWQINLFNNKFLLGAWLFGVLALIAAIYFPPLNMLLKTTPLYLDSWKIIIGMGVINIALIEFVKWIFIRNGKTQE